MRISDVLIRLIGARDPNCPNEADVLGYSESRLSTGRRAQIERHFADCHDCREVLAFLGQDSQEVVDPVTEAAVSAQTNRVLAYIQNDERKRTRSQKRDRARAGIYVSVPKLASVGAVISAIAVGAVLMFTMGQSPAHAAMEAMRLAEMRYTEPRVSGGFDHSDFVRPTRGGESNNKDTVHLDRAEDKVKAAAQEPAAVEARLVLARVWLARGDTENAKRALEILDQLMKGGVETPEALNDLGVARFQLNEYLEAIDCFTKALEKSPAYDEALFNRALAEQRDRRDAEARQDWQQFINQSSDEEWKNEARDYLSRLSPLDR